MRQGDHQGFQGKIYPIQCSHCEKFYASDIALKLHLKLKHLRNSDEKAYSTEDSHCLNDPNSQEHPKDTPAHITL
jgi:hypothetical protein